MKHIQAAPLLLGVPLLLAVAGAIWRAASLRSSMISEYQSRLDLAIAGIDTKAATALRRLTEHTAEMLGTVDQPFDPTRATANPNELRDLVGTAHAFLSIRQKLPLYYQSLLRVGPSLLAFLCPLLLTILLALSYFSGWAGDRTLGYIGLWSSISLLVLIALTTAYYIFFQLRFSGAEMRSRPDADQS